MLLFNFYIKMPLILVKIKHFANFKFPFIFCLLTRCFILYYTLLFTPAWFITLQLERKSGETHLAGHSVRAQLAKTKRWLNPPQQRHHIEVLYPSPRTNTRLLPNIHSQKIHPVLLVLFPPNKLYQRNDVTYFASGSYSDHILLNSSK